MFPFFLENFVSWMLVIWQLPFFWLLSDLPVSSYGGTVSASLQGSSIVVDTTHGVHLRCTGQRPQCVIQLDQQYRNHAVGLLGTNDGNLNNDMMLRTGEVRNAQFAGEKSDGTTTNLTIPGPKPSKTCTLSFCTDHRRHVWLRQFVRGQWTPELSTQTRRPNQNAHLSEHTQSTMRPLLFTGFSFAPLLRLSGSAAFQGFVHKSHWGLDSSHRTRKQICMQFSMQILLCYLQAV